MARGWESRRNQLTIFVREFFFPEKSTPQTGIPSSLFSWNSALRATGSQPLVPRALLKAGRPSLECRGGKRVCPWF